MAEIAAMLRSLFQMTGIPVTKVQYHERTLVVPEATVADASRDRTGAEAAAGSPSSAFESRRSPAAASLSPNMATAESAYTALWAPFDPSARMAVPSVTQAEASGSAAAVGQTRRGSSVSFKVPAAEADGPGVRANVRSRPSISDSAVESDAAATSTNTAAVDSGGGRRAGAMAFYGAEAAVLSRGGPAEMAGGYPSASQRTGGALSMQRLLRS